MASGRRRKVLIVLASVFALIIIAAALIATIEISSPRLKRMLTARAEEALGVPVRAERLSIRLLKGLQVRGIGLGEPGAEFFTAEGILLECNFLEMLKRRFTVRNLVVESPVITLNAGDGAFVPFVLPAHFEEEGSGIEFKLERVQMVSGQVRTRTDEEDNGFEILADELFLEARSEGIDRPVRVRIDGAALEGVAFSTAGSLAFMEDFRLDLESEIGIEWERAGARLSRLAGMEKDSISGRGVTYLTVSKRGDADGIEIKFSGDATGQQIAYGGFFEKPEGFGAALRGSALLKHPVLMVESAVLEARNSVFRLSGELNVLNSTAVLDVSADIIAEETAALLTALKDAGIGGKASASAQIIKPEAEPLRAEGECRIEDWKFRFLGGDFVSFDFSLLANRFNFQNIQGKIGQGSLAGSGFFEPGEEYNFSIEGVDIDIEDFFLKNRDEDPPFQMTGTASLSAGLGGKAEGVEHMDGAGRFALKNGTVTAMPWVESFLDVINLSELMPFAYSRINTDFLIKEGVLEAEGSVDGENARIKTEKATLNLVKNEKDVRVQFLLAPHLVEKQRSKFREFDRFFYIDREGYAHMSIIWDGPIEETMPNIPASLIQTGLRRLMAK